MDKILAFVLLTTISFFSFAGSEVGTVSFQHGQYGSNSTSAGKLFFFLEGSSKTGSPACATISGGERWVIDNNWPGAQAQLSILMAAYLSGAQVLVRGSSDCAVWGDTETAIDIIFN